MPNQPESPILVGNNISITSLLPLPDFTIYPHQATFLWGESGAGKSTLLKFCNATVTPHTGTVSYKGTDVAELDTVELRKDVMLVAQQVFLFEGTIAQNFATYHEYRGTTPPTEEQMRACLAICHIEAPLSRDVSQMSGGQRQRVFIAIHLSFKPAVLMLDEPTAALDSATAHMVLTDLIAYCKTNRVTLVIISHDKELMDTYADATIHLPPPPEEKTEHL